MDKRFELLTLGSSSAIPTGDRFTSAHLLNANGRFYLIDCGEGCQMQLRKYKCKIQSISAIFISHLHGDHIFGLPGLLSTMHLLGRQKELKIFSPKGLKEIIELILAYGHSKFNYSIDFVELQEQQDTIYLDKAIIVDCFPLNHRIDCFAFKFTEQEKLRNIKKDKIDQYCIPSFQIPDIKAGADFTSPSGAIVPNNELTHKKRPSKVFVYCTDTKFHEALIPFASGCNLLYHEATFMEADAQRAAKTFHSTAKQAASMAQKTASKQLLLGHFSARYSDLNELLEEAKAVFENTILSQEGLVTKIED